MKCEYFSPETGSYETVKCNPPFLNYCLLKIFSQGSCKTIDLNSYAGKSRAMCRLHHIATLPVSNIHMLYTSIITPAQKSATKRKKKEEAVKRKKGMKFICCLSISL